MKRKKRVKTKPAPKVKHAKKVSLFVIVPLILVSIFVIGATTYKIVEIVLTNTTSINFPKLEVYLTSVPIEQIDAESKDIKYAGNNATLTIDGESTNFENVEIKGRGNSTWMRTYKKPYQIKFAEKTNLFNLGKGRKWVLLANHFDSTHIKTSLAYYLESVLNTEYPLNGHHIELYIDDVYRGLYYLSEKVEIDGDRIALNNPYGVIVEMDNLRGTPEECFYTKNGECLLPHDSVNKDYEQAAMDNFVDSFNKLETAIKRRDFTTVKSLIDVDSFATYFLLNEFLVNRDAYSASFFMYKDGENDKIHAGPGWDFDLCIGNKNDNEDFSHSPLDTMALKELANSASKKSDPKAEPTSHAETISTIVFDLMEIPEFETRVKEIYQNTISGKGEAILDYIKNQADYIHDTVKRNQERWKLKTNFDDEIEYLIDWVAKRYDHFEQTYGVNAE